MNAPNMLLLYVGEVARSARFYAELLDCQPIDESPNFAMLPLSGGVMLGLWASHDVVPAANAAGGSEIIFSVESPDAVAQRHADWTRRGLPIAQAPTAMDFGFTFVALDPDGHRLRVMSPTQTPTQTPTP